MDMFKQILRQENMISKKYDPKYNFELSLSNYKNLPFILPVEVWDVWDSWDVKDRVEFDEFTFAFNLELTALHISNMFIA